MDWLSSVKELFGFAFPLLERLPIIRAILSSVLLFFLPGFAWTLVFFRQISVIERVTLSLALSIVVVTLSLVFANMLVGIKITGFNSVLIILVVTILPLVAYYLNRLIRRRKEEREDVVGVVIPPVKAPPAGEVTAEDVEEMPPEEATDIIGREVLH